MKDYYKLLGVSPGATSDELKKAYRKLARQWHPDVNASDEAKSRFQELQEAYEVLTQPDLKQKYDAHRRMANLALPDSRLETLKAELKDLILHFKRQDLAYRRPVREPSHTYARKYPGDVRRQLHRKERYAHARSRGQVAVFKVLMRYPQLQDFAEEQWRRTWKDSLYQIKTERVRAGVRYTLEDPSGFISVWKESPWFG